MLVFVCMYQCWYMFLSHSHLWDPCFDFVIRSIRQVMVMVFHLPGFHFGYKEMVPQPCQVFLHICCRACFAEPIPGKQIRFLKRTMVEKNGQGINPWNFVLRSIRQVMVMVFHLPECHFGYTKHGATAISGFGHML